MEIGDGNDNDKTNNRYWIEIIVYVILAGPVAARNHFDLLLCWSFYIGKVNKLLGINFNRK